MCDRIVVGLAFNIQATMGTKAKVFGPQAVSV
jgi:hypothetical protein